MKPTLPRTLIRNGRRLYGAIYTFPDGRQVYLAFRKTKEIFRAGEATISDAVRIGTAAWALDDSTILDMRLKGIKALGVHVIDTDDIYLTSIANFYDKTKVKLLNYERRGGALQRYLPLQYFKRRTGRARLKAGL